MPKFFAYKRSAVAVATALGVGTVLGIASQQAAAQEAARVVVTGSQIPRVDAETPAPVQVITSDQIKASGFTTISDVLQSITANGQGTLSQGFGRAFAGGSSGVSLRGLTVGSTLVLIDGHRMAPYPLSDDGQRPFVDISNIPFEAVDRIEILKDGASAIYGSDAMAGVVNVILKKSFVGTSMTADYGTSQHGGGQTKHLSVIHGFGNAAGGDSGYFAIEYRHQDPVMLSQRSGDWANMNWSGQGGNDMRPGTVNANAATPRFKVPYLQVPGSSVASGAGSFAFFPGSGCSYASFAAGGCIFNNTWAQIQPGTENVNLLASSTTRFSNDWELNLKASLFDSKSEQIGQPAAIPFSSFAGVTAFGPNLPVRIIGARPAGTFQVPATYPGNTLGVAANIRGTLPLSDWPRGFAQDYDTKATRLVAELTGSLAGWDVKGSAGYTKVETAIRYSGLINFSGLATALADPVDPFLLGGGNDPFNLNRVSPVVNNTVSDVLKFVELRGNRELAKLQGGPLSLGVGVSYVTKDLNNPNPIERQLGLIAVPGAYAIGSDSDKSFYAELVAPVLKTLELDAAARYDDYNTYGSTTTPKVGFKFTPIKQFGIRGTASRGFRAPAATENGVSGSLFGFNQVVDPVLCPNPANPASAANVSGQCSLQVAYLQAANKSLQPEKSKSYTLGFIAEPIPRWSSTLDYYRITVDNQIITAASLPGFNFLPGAVRGAPQQVTFGDGSTGMSPVGLIQYVNSPWVNGQSTTTSGLEFETKYKFDLKQYGHLTAGVMYTHMINYDVTIGGTTFKLAGTHGPTVVSGDTGNPRDRAQLNFTWERGQWTVNTQTNYVSGYDVTDPSIGNNDCQTSLNNSATAFDNTGVWPSQYCKVGSFTYTNLNGNYKVGKNWTLFGSIVNLFDQKPPVDMQTYAGGGFNGSSAGIGIPFNPSLHQVGAIGRFYSIGANYKF